MHTTHITVAILLQRATLTTISLVGFRNPSTHSMAGLVTCLPFKNTQPLWQTPFSKANKADKAMQHKATQDKAHSPAHRLEVFLEMHVDGKHGRMRIDCNLDEEAMGELHILTDSHAIGSRLVRFLSNCGASQAEA
jgi:hypothetical protein